MNDIEMFFGLRHDAIVCGHDHQDHVDPLRAGEHMFEEALVSRDIDDAELNPFYLMVGKSQFNGNTTLLFLFEPEKAKSIETVTPIFSSDGSPRRWCNPVDFAALQCGHQSRYSA